MELYYIIHSLAVTIRPNVSIDDGLVTAYWSGPNRTGVAIIFDGTGIYDYSIKTATSDYCEGIKSAFSYTNIPTDLKHGILTVIGELLGKANEDTKR
jgi:hypothetical protein